MFFTLILSTPLATFERQVFLTEIKLTVLAVALQWIPIVDTQNYFKLKF